MLYIYMMKYAIIGEEIMIAKIVAWIKSRIKSCILEYLSF